MVTAMEKIRIGIVGAGNIAANAHMPAYAVCDKAEVVAVADLNLEPGAELREALRHPERLRLRRGYAGR